MCNGYDELAQPTGCCAHKTAVLQIRPLETLKPDQSNKFAFGLFRSHAAVRQPCGSRAVEVVQLLCNYIFRK